MSVKKTNKLYVDKIMKAASYFNTEGNANNDGLLIAHVNAKPKGGRLRVNFKGNTTHWKILLVNEAKQHQDIAQAILEAADEIRAIMANKTAHN